jgi:hypothetical protein
MTVRVCAASALKVSVRRASIKLRACGEPAARWTAEGREEGRGGAGNLPVLPSIHLFIIYITFIVLANYVGERRPARSVVGINYL